MFIHSQKRCTFGLCQTKFCVSVSTSILRGLFSSNGEKLVAFASHFDRIRVENGIGRGIAHFKKQSNCLLLLDISISNRDKSRAFFSGLTSQG